MGHGEYRFDPGAKLAFAAGRGGSEMPRAPSGLALQEAYTSCELLESVVESLAKRLDPVLLSGPPTPVREVSEPPEGSSLTRNYRELSRRVQNAAEALQRLTERIDL